MGSYPTFTKSKVLKIKIIEFKAQVDELATYENKLKTLDYKYIGLDHQIDTYFNATKDRLKLREGNIENSLIKYARKNTAASKLSSVLLYKHLPNPALKDILTDQLGIKVIVDKQRKIYFIDNVKFHFDEVKGLGTFMEVEAIESDTVSSIEELQKQCEITEKQLVEVSYSDLLLKKVYLQNSEDISTSSI